MRDTLLLATFLLLPAAYWVQRLTNSPITVLYLLIGTAGLHLVVRLSRRWLLQAVNERVATIVACGGLLLLIGAFLIIYPRVNCQVPNCGSDRDDALHLATGELLAGRYPYYPKTYHGNPITPMPGAILLAVPFQLLGNVAYQTFFWLIAFFWLARRLLGNTQRAVVLCGLLLLSPAVLHEILTGGDLLTNGLYVLVLGVLAAEGISAENTSPILKTTLAILFGLSLSSRVNFALFAPLVIAYMDHHGGRKRAINYGILITLTAIGITLPFYWTDPAHFAPLQRTSELSDLDLVIPYLGSLWVPLTMVVATGILCLPRFQTNAANLLLNMGIVQLLPVVIGTPALSLQSKTPDLQLTAFGLVFMMFGALGTWLCVFSSPTNAFVAVGVQADTAPRSL